MVHVIYKYSPGAEQLRALQLLALPAEGRHALIEGLHSDFVLGLYPLGERSEESVARTLTEMLARDPQRSLHGVKDFMTAVRESIDRHMLVAHRMARYVRYASSNNRWEQFQMSSGADSRAVMAALGPRPSHKLLGFNDGDIYGHLADNANVIAALLVRDPKILSTDQHGNESLALHVRFRFDLARLLARGL